MSLDLLWGDLRLAWLNAVRRPGFTLLVAATLALGLGVNSAVFALVDAVLLRPLPYRNSSQLVRLLQLAEGAEKNPILARLEKVLGHAPVGKLTERVALSALKAIDRYRPLPDASHSGERMQAVKATRPHLGQLSDVTSALIGRGSEVDPSIVKILRLWADSDTADPAVRECFGDAAKYLEVALAANSPRGRRRRGKPS